MIYRAYVLFAVLLSIAAYLALPHTPADVVGPNPVVGLLVLAPALWVLTVIGRREAA